MPKPSFSYIINTKIQGIPCKIGIGCYSHTPAYRGSAHSCDSDYDYYGGTDMDYIVLDRKGYVAYWLAKKMTVKDECAIEELIEEYFRNYDNS